MSGDDRDETDYSAFSLFAVPREEVEANFRAFGLPLDRTLFLEGWFHETLPGFDSGPLAVLRLDGDLYSSTRVALDSLYRNLSRGGFLIIDDWNIPECRRAVLDFRTDNSVSEEIVEIDGMGVYWRKNKQLDS